MIKHIKCNIFESGADVILHQVNCQGVMGSGVAKQVKEKYPKAYWTYKMLCDATRHKDDLLGEVQVVQGDDGVFIANLFAQENYGYDGKRYTDYIALIECFRRICSYPVFDGRTIAIPYLMGCRRGGGDWDIVYRFIEEAFQDHDVLICEYDGG